MFLMSLITISESLTKVIFESINYKHTDSNQWKPFKYLNVNKINYSIFVIKSEIHV